MDASLKLVRTVRMAMLVAIVLYVLGGERAAHTAAPGNRVFYYAIAALAVAAGGGTVVARRLMVLRAEEALVRNEQDALSLARWRSGYVLIYALCEAVALYGLVLRFMGFTLTQVAPFYVVGFVLLFFFSPRRPSSAIG